MIYMKNKDENIIILDLLVKTSTSFYKMRNARLNSIKDSEVNQNYKDYLYKNTIEPIDQPLFLLGREINKILNYIPIYLTFLKGVNALSIYDCAELIVLIDDIERFKKFDNLLSYSGMIHTKKSYNDRLYKLLLKIGSKLVRDIKYDYLYEIIYEEYKEKHPEYTEDHLEKMASRKLIKKFLKQLYKEWNNTIKEV